MSTRRSRSIRRSVACRSPNGSPTNSSDEPNRGAGEATFGGLTIMYFATGDNSGRENATH